MTSGLRPQVAAVGLPVGQDNGFTIVETLIFLAVSALILVSALTLVGGTQRKTEFNQGVRDFQQQLDDIVDNVATGYTAGQGDFSCSTASGAPVLSAGSVELGQNADCIFIGKLLQFANEGKFDVYSIIGRRTTDGSTLVKSVTDTQPRVSTLADVLVEHDKIRNNLIPKSVKSNHAAFSAIALVSTLNSLDSGTNTSGSQQIDLLALNPGTLPSTLAVAAVPTWFNSWGSSVSDSAYNTLGDSAKANGISVCFEGPGGQNATVSIGGAGSTTTTQLQYGQGACP